MLIPFPLTSQRLCFLTSQHPNFFLVHRRHNELQFSLYLHFFTPHLTCQSPFPLRSNFRLPNSLLHHLFAQDDGRFLSDFSRRCKTPSLCWIRSSAACRASSAVEILLSASALVLAMSCCSASFSASSVDVLTSLSALTSTILWRAHRKGPLQSLVSLARRERG